MEKKLVLIDGHSILHRAYYGMPELSNSEGVPTNAVYGFLNIMFRIIEQEQPDYLIVAFDVKAPTFRHEMYAAYKGTRKPMPDSLREQVPLMKEVLQAMQIKTVEKAGYEADDLLGTLAKRGEKEGFQVSLISGDRDLLQIASDKIKIRIPKTKGRTTTVEDYYASDVMEKYQLTPAQIIEMKALMGDSADNIPGLPGIGEKTAIKILQSYPTLEEAYEHAEEIMPKRAGKILKEHYDLAILSKKLATIHTSCDLSFDFEEARMGELFTKEAYDIFTRLEFRNYLSRFGELEKEEEESIEEGFVLIESYEEYQVLWKKVQEAEHVGISLIEEASDFLGFAVCFDEKNVSFVKCDSFFLQEQVIKSDLLALCASGKTMASFHWKSDYQNLCVKEQRIPWESQKRMGLFDVSIAAYLLNPLKSDYSYEELSREYLSKNFPSKKDLLGKAALRSALEGQTEAFLKAVCYEAYTAYQAAPILAQKLTQEKMDTLFFEMEMPLVFVLADMELEGIYAKRDILKEQSALLETKISKLEEAIYEEAAEEFNINSPKQLGIVLFEHLMLPHGKKTKTGYSTAADILEKLAPEYPIVSRILEYRQHTKLKSTYADGLESYIGEDERIHSNFKQTITATGRISSTEPNLQNIPIRMELGRQIRKAFLPKEGCVFVDADYSQIELRVLAHMSGDETLIEAYRQQADIHRMTASVVFHTPFEKVTSLQRRNAKAVNFGIVYGISAFGLSQDLSISREKAKEYIDNYFKIYPGVKQFLGEMVVRAKKDGYVTTMFGRRRPVPELKSSNFMQRSFGERVAMNSPIQGTAADIIKIAMIRVAKRLKKEQLRSRLILQVHDELLIEAHREEAEQIKQILTEEMMGAAELLVPLEIDIHEGSSWFDAK